MPDNLITCPSCGEVNPAVTMVCGFSTLPLVSRLKRPSDDGNRIITFGSLISNRCKLLVVTRNFINLDNSTSKGIGDDLRYLPWIAL